MNVDVAPDHEASGAKAVGVRLQSWFFVALSVIICAVVLIAFGPTFFLRTTLSRTDILLGNRGIPAYLVVHGVILTAWFALFATQTWLVASGKTRLHKSLGVAGVAMAAAVVTSGSYTLMRFVPRTIDAIHASGRPPDQWQSAVRQIAVPVLVADSIVLLVFALLVCAAVYWRRRPNIHKRLMLLASVTILSPAFATGRPVGRTLATIMPVDPWYAFAALCIAALIWYDRTTKRRIEPATIWGTAGLIAAVLATEILIRGAAGATIACWLTNRPDGV